MTNNLQSEFANVKISASSNSVPNNASPIKVSVDKYIERIDNVDKLSGIESKYGDVFGFTKGEITKFYKTYNEEATKILQS